MSSRESKARVRNGENAEAKTTGTKNSNVSSATSNGKKGGNGNGHRKAAATTDAGAAGGGRHMSNHFAKPSIGIQNVSSATGNHSQQAAGLGKAIKCYKSDAICFYSGGESACSEGFFYEALNGATTGKYPVIFV